MRFTFFLFTFFLFAFLAGATSFAEVPASTDYVLTLPERLDSPASITVDIPKGSAGSARGVAKVTVTASSKQSVQLFAFGPDPYQDGRWRNRIVTNQPSVVRADEPLHVDVSGVPGTQVVVVAADPDETLVTERDVFGAISATTSLEERALDSHMLIENVTKSPMLLAAEEARVEFAARLFLGLDPAYIVYVTALPEDQEQPVIGEPLLITSVHPGNYGNQEVNFLRANGMKWTWNYVVGRGDRLSDYLSTTRPKKIVLPPVVAPARMDEGFDANLADEWFLVLESTTPRIAKYRAAKEVAGKCWDQKWQQLDPSGKAGNYDVVSFDAKGKVKNIEGYADKLQRRVDSACKLSVIYKERNSIRDWLKSSFKVTEQKRLDAIAKHLSAL